MPCLAARCQLDGHRRPRWPLGWATLAHRALWLVLAACIALAAAPARAQGVEVLELAARRDEQAVLLDYQLRLTLPHGVEEAALRGVPLHFTTQASVWRSRWYWRDERIGRADRAWRISFQPLTSSWRVSQGGLGQSHTSLTEALATMTRSAGWKLADLPPEADGRFYIEFAWQLDTSQLPRPMQIGLGGIGGAGEWTVGVERSLKFSP